MKCLHLVYRQGDYRVYRVQIHVSPICNYEIHYKLDQNKHLNAIQCILKGLKSSMLKLSWHPKSMLLNMSRSFDSA